MARRGSNLNVLLLPDGLKMEKQAECCAINWAVYSGACNRCRHLKRCENDRGFTFPAEAACMKKKQEVLREWQKKQDP